MRHLLATVAVIALAFGEARAQQMARPEPQWTDYCKDFSEEACARMRKVVEAKVTPSYCKPGFGIVPTALSNEQLRICYVMPPLRAAAVPAPSQLATPQPRPLPNQTTPVRTFSTRQVEAIRMTEFSALTGEYCQEIIENGGAGRELIDAGIELSDFGSPEYERIRRDARATLAAMYSAGRCGEIWRVLGPGGSYGRELVRLRRPSDPPYKWNPLREN